MWDYELDITPRFDYIEYIVTVDIKDGVTGICDYAFYGCLNLTDITFPDSLLRICSDAFVFDLIRGEEGKLLLFNENIFGGEPIGEVVSGSIKIKFYKEYLDTLESGTYNLKIKINSQEASDLQTELNIILMMDREENEETYYRLNGDIILPTSAYPQSTLIIQ